MGTDEQGLSPEQKDFFDSQGYAVLPGFASAEECTAMMRRMDELVKDFDPTTVSVFSTTKQKEHTDHYFYNSANNISFFFEEKAFDADNKLKQSKSLSINKVGHALHDLDPVFRDFSRSEKVSALAASLGYKRPAPIQSMYIYKQPGIGGEVVPHQDNTFLYTEPTTCVGLWLALEDATKENGCLWVLPESHKGGVARRFLKESTGVRFDKEAPKWDISAFVPLEVKAGTLVLLHGDLVHQSFENTSPKSRQAYSVHVVETVGCSYPETNWLQRSPDFPLKPFFGEEVPVEAAA